MSKLLCFLYSAPFQHLHMFDISKAQWEKNGGNTNKPMSAITNTEYCISLDACKDIGEVLGAEAKKKKKSLGSQT